MLSNEQSVRELIIHSTQNVVQQAQFVHINDEAVSQFAKAIPDSWNYKSAWDKTRHFYDGSARTAQWVFIVDALNFSFWLDEGKERWQVEWKGELVKGYWALACSLNLTMKKNIPLTDAAFLEQIEDNDLETILDGTGVVPMFHERMKVLREIGSILRTRYDGTIINLLEEAKHSVDAVVRLIVDSFPCFQDTATYQSKTIYFFKRAQIFCSDLWGAFDGTDFGSFQDLENLTAFADYKLPQTLRALNILQYVPELAQRIDSLQLIPPGSAEEIEIRAATICAVESLHSHVLSRGLDLPVFAIDWWLWEISHEPKHEVLPHHRTRTIFY